MNLLYLRLDRCLLEDIMRSSHSCRRLKLLCDDFSSGRVYFCPETTTPKKVKSLQVTHLLEPLDLWFDFTDKLKAAGFADSRRLRLEDVWATGALQTLNLITGDSQESADVPARLKFTCNKKPTRPQDTCCCSTTTATQRRVTHGTHGSRQSQSHSPSIIDGKS